MVGTVATEESNSQRPVALICAIALAVFTVFTVKATQPVLKEQAEQEEIESGKRQTKLSTTLGDAQGLDQATTTTTTTCPDLST
ncbi:hypothetical protein ACLKA7_013271 [Drosophila subpalustris]